MFVVLYKKRVYAVSDDLDRELVVFSDRYLIISNLNPHLGTATKCPD